MEYKSIILLVLLIMLTAASGLSDDKIETSDKFHKGTVKKTEPAGPYLYLLVNVDGREFWISTIAKYLPEDITPGDNIEYTGGLLIQGFNSPTTAKSFKYILLVSKIKVIRATSNSD